MVGDQRRLTQVIPSVLWYWSARSMKFTCRVQMSLKLNHLLPVILFAHPGQLNWVVCIDLLHLLCVWDARGPSRHRVSTAGFKAFLFLALICNTTECKDEAWFVVMTKHGQVRCRWCHFKGWRNPVKTWVVELGSYFVPSQATHNLLYIVTAVKLCFFYIWKSTCQLQLYLKV